MKNTAQGAAFRVSFRLRVPSVALYTRNYTWSLVKCKFNQGSVALRLLSESQKLALSRRQRANNRGTYEQSV